MFRIAILVSLGCAQALTVSKNTLGHGHPRKLHHTRLQAAPVKEREAINGEKINGDNASGIQFNHDIETGLNGETTINGKNETDSSYTTDLVDFFDKLFQPYTNGEATNGESSLSSDIQRSIKSLSETQSKASNVDILDLTVDFANEVYRNISTNVDNASSHSASNFESMALASLENVPAEVTNSITDLFRQLEVALDERFVEFCEEIAFYDTEGLRSEDVKPGPNRLLEEDYERMRRERNEERAKRRKREGRELGRLRNEAIKKTLGKNTTVSVPDENGRNYMNEVALASKRMRTKDIMRNFNVAPIYYTIALFMRWAEKATVPPMAMLMFLRGLAYPLKWSEGGKNKFDDSSRKRRRLFGGREAVASTAGVGRTKKFGNEEVADEEFIQGWKRTGEIAAKGKRGRAWATLRRSAEIWFYFSSFYIKDYWILKNYDGGRWNEERFKEERSKLGAQLTQNLLKLGPTFIKVMATCSTASLFQHVPNVNSIIFRSTARTDLFNKNRHRPKRIH
jgi:hypothetical protein